jgi:WD40 repeat protein
MREGSGRGGDIRTETADSLAPVAAPHDETLPMLSGAAAALPIVDPRHYERGVELGRGGLGRVVAAADLRLGRPLAIKELHNSDLVNEARFLREALITARLQHPGVVPIYEAGRWPDGRPFYAMKKVAGRSLKDLITAAPSRDERLALLPHGFAAAATLAYAHRRGILHRDLKPANVLVGEFGETVVIDWGLAKDLSADEDALSATASSSSGDATMAGSVLGTPAYMPPEQAEGRTVDERADVYALGSLLYHTLSGTPPYGDASAPEMLRAVVSRPPPPLATLEPDLPAELGAIVARAMARDAADRYPSARELQDDLHRFHTGQLVSVYSYSTVALVRRWIARNRIAVTVGAVLLAALVLTAVLSVRRIMDARQVAEVARAHAELRAHQLLLGRARSAVAEDPTAALAWLKLYPRDAPRWPAVRTIAADARGRGAARLVLRGHDEYVIQLRFLGDGQLLSASWDTTLRVWNTASGESRVLSGHQREVMAMALSPDGTALVSGGYDEARLWDLGAGTSRPLPGSAISALSVAWSARGVIAVGHRDAVELYDAGGTHQRRLAAPSTDYVPGVEFSPDGRFLAIAGGAVQVHDLVGEHVMAVCGPWTLGDGTSRRVAFSPDGTWLICAGDEPAVWNTETGSRRLLGPADAKATAVAFVPGAGELGGDLLIGRLDGIVDRWRLSGPGQDGDGAGASGPERSQITLLSGAAVAVVASPDGRWAAAAGSDGHVHLIDLTVGAVRVLRGHQRAVSALAFSPDSRHLASAGVDRSIRVWDTASADAMVARGQGWVFDVAFAAAGTRVVAITTEGDLLIADVAAGAVESRAQEAPFHALAVSPHGTTFVTGDADGEVKLWSVAGGEPRRLGRHPRGAAFHVAFSPDGARVASGSNRGEVRMFGLSDGSERVLGSHQGFVGALAFSPDGATLASGGKGGTVKMWQQGGGERVFAGHTQTVRALAFTLDGVTLASGSEDGTIRLWDVTTDEARVLAGHRRYVMDVAFSPDGTTLASGSNDGTVRLWNVATGASRVLRTDTATDVAFSPDGGRLAVAAFDGATSIFELATGEHRRLPTGLLATWRVAWAPDGRSVATGSVDGTVALWRDDLSADPAALLAEIDHITTAVIGPDDLVVTPPPR